MLQNAYFLAKIGADTAENEQHFAEILPKTGNYPTGPLGAAAPGWRGSAAAPERRRKATMTAAAIQPDAPALEAISIIGEFCKEKYNFFQILAGSFSAVSKPNFARKYAFDSIFQALQDLHPFAPLQSQNFRKKSV